MHEAVLYTTDSREVVNCGLCSHRCHIKPGKRGICAVRENIDGTLFSLVYGKMVAEHVDPVEKKPLFHFLPGSRTYSIATVGCNFDCLHCQNHEISQYPHQHGGAVIGEERSAETIVKAALDSNCASISYTYVEPTIFYEFAEDCAQLAHERQLKNIFVSNGYLTPDACRRIAQLLDGINIDLKGFTDDFYTKICRARLQPVLDTIRLMHSLGVWVEVTTLLIPGLNDSAEELRDIAAFIHDVDPAVPWHVTAFYPTYKMLDKSPTPTAALQLAADIGREQGLLYVYEGNRPGRGGENTLCPSCGRELIIRQGFTLQADRLENGHCSCGRAINGVWKEDQADTGRRA